MQRIFPVNSTKELHELAHAVNQMAESLAEQETRRKLLSLYPSESFDVSTGDNRFYCYVTVVDDLSAVDEAAIREEVNVYEPLIYPPEVFESSGMSCCG